MNRLASIFLAAALLAAALLAPPAANAAAPSISSASFSAVGETTATLQATIDTGAKKTEYHFQYVTLADYEAASGFGPGTHDFPEPDASLLARPSAKGDLTEGSAVVTNVTVAAEGALAPGQAISGKGIPLATTIVAVKAGELTLSKAVEAGKTASAVTLTATGPQPVSAQVSDLAPGTVYRFRLVAENSDSAEVPSVGPTATFATFATPPAGLPDLRAYEQATPVEKDGGEAESASGRVRAGPLGGAVTFFSNFGFPGGLGAQIQPVYLASRGEGQAGWSTRGLMPPAPLGEGAHVLGWLPGFSTTYSMAERFTSPREVALLAQPAGQSPVAITPYVTSTFFYVGATPDGAVVFFETRAALPPEEGRPPIPAAIEGASNLYAWDRETGTLSLASVFNDESSPPKGAHAGPYDWARSNSAEQLAKGGAERAYYLQDTHAVSEDGALFFTAADSGRLYERINPTAPQSAVAINGEGEEECTEAAKACTLHVSATHKENGIGTEDGSDPAGPQSAVFQAASAGGSAAFFTSAEKLTDDANTGPEQPPAQIGTAKLGASGPEEGDESFIPVHALGTAVSPDGEYLYWADPSKGSIGRAKLTAPDPAATVEAEFIVPRPTECGKEIEPGVREEGESHPRYVAVDSEHLYWTNTGCPETPGKPKTEGGGSIGRAEIDGSGALVPESVEAAFIPGRVETSPGVFVNRVSNPQGIAVNAEHIYWANDPYEGVSRAIARATIEGEAVEPAFFQPFGSERPAGVALSATHIYFASYNEGNNFSNLLRVPLEGGAVEQIFIGPDTGRVRGVALDGSHVYWASQGDGAIGRAGLGEFGPGTCEIEHILGCERHYLPLQGLPEGIATDPSEEHLYWSVNGEAPPNPGTDLYRFRPPGAPGCAEARGCLADLTPDPTGNGAEVQGVLGASPDGSHLYFVANGVLAANQGAGGSEAQPGDCHTLVPHGHLGTLNGHCNLYLWREGETSFIARLSAKGLDSDVSDWVPTVELGGGYAPRTSRVSEDGEALLFRSAEKLTAYENKGVPEFYLYRAGEADPIRCLTCNPTGLAPAKAPDIGDNESFHGLSPGGIEASLLTRNLSADGDRFFFETAEALSPSDADGVADVYEWEAPGTGTCAPGTPSYSPLNEGCLYLISTGADSRPSELADASESGEDVFFFTFQRLVGQDQDQLRDVYDARVEGGLSSQNPPPPPPPCAGPEACRPPAPGAPTETSPATPGFQGPGNLVERQPRGCPKGRRTVKRKGKTRCVKKKAPRKGRRHNQRRAHR